MNSEFTTWNSLRKASAAIYPKAALGLILIYIVFYLKMGGINTAPLEITLAGCLLTIFAVVLQQIFSPYLIVKYYSVFEYESHLHKQVEDKWLSLQYCCLSIENHPPTIREADRLGYRFDEAFSYSHLDLKATLGESGLLSFVARLAYLRANIEKPILRFTIVFLGLIGLLTMYWRPIQMIWSIYVAKP
jgi:hypothetical protein